ncbi:ArsR family transcriptional regulator, partial [Hominilimicola sp.]
SVSDYAKHMGISQSAVSQQLKTIYKKLKKFL